MKTFLYLDFFIWRAEKWKYWRLCMMAPSEPSSRCQLATGKASQGSVPPELKEKPAKVQGFWLAQCNTAEVREGCLTAQGTGYPS
jgi:hypothetical protein